jgi:NAD(P)-dependent dehydrogenase (short-subunit alcohol dehydrogenase family)
MSGRLEGKVVVAPGGSSGIGRVVAERFVAEGAAVAIGVRRAGAGEAVAARLRAGGDSGRDAFGVGDGSF